MKSTAFFSAGGAGVLASLLTYFGHDGGGSLPSLISALLGGGGLLSIILGFIPDKKPDGGGGEKPTGGFSLANFMQAAKMFKAAKGADSPGGADLTPEEITAIVSVLLHSEATSEDVQKAVAGFSFGGGGGSGKGIGGDVAKYAQFLGQFMQLKPVVDAFKAKGGPPAYTEMLLIWDAETVIPAKFGVDPRTTPAPKAAA